MVTGEVHFARVGHEAIVLDSSAEYYYGLDRVGTLIWCRLAEGDTLGQVHKFLVATFTVDSGVLWADMVEFLRDLSQRELIAVQL